MAVTREEIHGFLVEILTSRDIDEEEAEDVWSELNDRLIEIDREDDEDETNP